MKKTKRVWLLLIPCIVFVVLVAGCSLGGPSKDLLKKDMAEEYKAQSGWGYVSVKEMDIVYSDCKDDIYKAEIDVVFYLGGKYDNEDSEDLAWNSEPYTVIVEYEHYSKGGWKLIDIEIDD